MYNNKIRESGRSDSPEGLKTKVLANLWSDTKWPRSDIANAWPFFTPTHGLVVRGRLGFDSLAESDQKTLKVA